MEVLTKEDDLVDEIEAIQLDALQDDFMGWDDNGAVVTVVYSPKMSGDHEAPAAAG